MKNSVVFVTPEKATELLSLNSSNRPVRKTWVNQLSNIISRGEWKITHQGIALSKKGILLDGQHRLMAIIDSGIPCYLNIASDVDDDVYLAMDLGAKRNMNDIFNIGGFQAEVLRFAAKLIFTGAPTPQQVCKFIGTKYHESTNELQEYCPTSVKVYSSAPMRFAAAYHHSRITSPSVKEIVFQQYRALCLHDFDAMDATSKAFVKAIMSSGKGAVVDQTTRFAHGLKAFNPRARNLDRFRMQDSEFSSLLNAARKEIRLVAFPEEHI